MKNDEKQMELLVLQGQLQETLKGLKTEIESFERKRLDFKNLDHSYYLKQIADITAVYQKKISDQTYSMRVLMHK
ncbi:hypothetical protein [Rufibacter roseus]|uniref:Uncharacterized protein n=1 Tax=Rufibacter roseus TaxID=1567108 RepID=A0ABW2DST1_9BACT|nr:hypothetical protein [Rufibacter roseus]